VTVVDLGDDLLSDLEKIPLAGDSGEMNRKVEQVRRLRVLSPFKLPKVGEVLDAYHDWGVRGDARNGAPDPRPLIPAALAEIQAVIQELQS
jgi:hypothetical protein